MMKRKYRKKINFFFSLLYQLIFTLALSLSLFNGYAQEYTIKNYSKTDGLIQSSTNELFQDRNGFIRLIGDKSCSVFNGTTFKKYPHLQNFPNEDVIKVREDLSGKRLLLSRSGKLFIQESSNEYQFDTELLFEDAKINSFLILEDNSVLLGNNRFGLVKLDGDSVYSYSTKEGLYSNQIEDIYSDQINTYIVSNKGINLYKNGQVIPLLKNDGLTHKKVIQQSNGNFWSFVDSIGIIRYQINEDKNLKAINTLYYWLDKDDQSIVKILNTNIFSLGSETKFIAAEVNLGQVIWLATNNGLFSIIQNSIGEVYIYQITTKLDIKTLLISRNKDIYCTAEGKGLIKVSRSYFENYSNENGFPAADVNLLFIDNADRVWFNDNRNWLGYFSCEKGFRLPPKPIKEKGLKAISVTHYDKDNLLISLGKKLLLLGTEGYSEPESLKNLPNEIKNVIFTDSENDIWIGCNKEGLWKYSKGKLKKIGFHEQDIDVLDLFEDRHNNLWVYTNKGLFQSENDLIYETDYKFSQPNPKINTFFNDYEGNLWLGTSDGIYIFNNRRLVDSINFTPDVSSNNITAICQYNQALIIGTRDGLVLNMGKQYKYFGVGEGLISNSINARKIINLGGQILIGSKDGISFFQLSNYLAEQESPKIYVTKYTTNLDTVNIVNHHIKKSYDFIFNQPTDFVSFSIDLINFKNSLYNLEYQLVCDGDTSAWHQVQIQSNDIFINKPDPGKNKVLIRSNFVGHTESHQIEINFTIRQSFYKKFAFKLTVTVLGLIILILSLKSYTKLFSKKPKKYTTSSLSETNSEKIKSQIEVLMNEKQYYKNPELSLQVLVDELGFSKEHISQVINTEFNSNFNALINSYRVKEACALLKENKGKKSNILQIGYQVGFNSKSSFNNAFKKQTGYSPTAFQNKYSS